MFQMLIHPSSGACDYLVCCCVGWLEACWCYVAGLSVGDVVSECRLIKLVYLYSNIKMMHSPIRIRFHYSVQKSTSHVSILSQMYAICNHWPSPEYKHCHSVLSQITTSPLEPICKFPRHLVQILGYYVLMITLLVSMKTSRSAWIRIVILICTSAQLFLLHKVICRLHVSKMTIY